MTTALPSETAIHEAAHAEVARAVGAVVVHVTPTKVQVQLPLTPEQRGMIAFAGALANNHDNPRVGSEDHAQLAESGIHGDALDDLRRRTQGIISAHWGEIVCLARRIDAGQES